MRSMHLEIVSGMLVLASLAGGFTLARGQKTGTQKAGTPETGYAVKKPVFGGACPTCPWGAMANVVKEVLKPYGWDVQVCYYCAGGPREARLVAGGKRATPPEKPS